MKYNEDKEKLNIFVLPLGDIMQWIPTKNSQKILG